MSKEFRAGLRRISLQADIWKEFVMKTCQVLALSVLLGSAGMASAQPGAASQFPMTVFFNENCIGFIVRDSEFLQLPCSALPDPFGSMVPTFTLPQPVTPGDVMVLHADGTLGDLIRFPRDPNDPLGMATTMLFYSDPTPNEPGETPPASDGAIFPPDIDPNAMSVTEMGNPEILDWFSYNPDMNTLYLGISDSQP
jgi:hypothetical protein